jgi:hypothetical protein
MPAGYLAPLAKMLAADRMPNASIWPVDPTAADRTVTELLKSNQTCGALAARTELETSLAKHRQALQVFGPECTSDIAVAIRAAVVKEEHALQKLVKEAPSQARESAALHQARASFCLQQSKHADLRLAGRQRSEKLAEQRADWFRTQRDQLSRLELAVGLLETRHSEAHHANNLAADTAHLLVLQKLDRRIELLVPEDAMDSEDSQLEPRPAAAAHPPTNGEAAPQQQPDATAQARCANALAASQAELHKLEQELVAKRAQVAEAAAATEQAAEATLDEFAFIVPKEEIAKVSGTYTPPAGGSPEAPTAHPMLPHCARLHGVMQEWMAGGASVHFSLAQMATASGLTAAPGEANSEVAKLGRHILGGKMWALFWQEGIQEEAIVPRQLACALTTALSRMSAQVAQGAAEALAAADAARAAYAAIEAAPPPLKRHRAFAPY